MLNFVDTFELMAFNFHGDEEQHHRFVHDAKLLIDAIVNQLHKNNSMFKDHLGELRKTGKPCGRHTLQSINIMRQALVCSGIC